MSEIADAGAPARPVAAPVLPPLFFGTRPDRSTPLSVVVDGPCTGLNVTLLGDETVISTSIESSDHESAEIATLATVDAHGIRDVSKVDGTGAPVALLGRFPERAWLVHEQGFRCDESTQLMKCTDGHWAPVPLSRDSMQSGDLEAYAAVGESIAYASTESGPCGGDGSAVTALHGDGLRPPRLDDDGKRVGALTGFASGEIFASVFIDGPGGASSAIEIRVLSGSGALERHGVPLGAKLTALAPDDAYVSYTRAGSGKNVPDEYIAEHFDGQTWSPFLLPPRTSFFSTLARAPDGTLWILANGVIFTRSKGAADWVPLAASGFAGKVGGVRQLTGVKEGAPWISTRDGALARYQDGQWTSVPLPKPPFSEKGAYFVESITVRDAGDVWVTARSPGGSAAWGANVTEDHVALLRTIAPDETLRCGGHLVKSPFGGDTQEWGLESWPPSAADDCATPLVLIADNDVTRVRGDFARTRAIFAKHADFDGATYEEVAAGDHRYFSAKVPNVQTGRDLLAFYAKKVHGAKPRLVCADPVPLRKFDLKTGEIR